MHNLARVYTLAAATFMALALLGYLLKGPSQGWLTGTVGLLWCAMAAYAWLRYYTWGNRPKHRKDDEK
jgi:threonine/homoserine efflux transporter RhtA